MRERAWGLFLWWEGNVPLGFPDGSDGKESACNAGDPGLIPGLGRFPGEEKGNPLQYSYLENSMDRGAWCVKVHGSQRVGLDQETNAFTLGLVRWLSGWRTCLQCRKHGRRCRFGPWVGKIPWKRKWHPMPVFLPGKSHG